MSKRDRNDIDTDIRPPQHGSDLLSMTPAKRTSQNQMVSRSSTFPMLGINTSGEDQCYARKNKSILLKTRDLEEYTRYCVTSIPRLYSEGLWTPRAEYLMVKAMFLLPVLHGVFVINGETLHTQDIVADYIEANKLHVNVDLVKRQFEKSLSLLKANRSFLEVCYQKAKFYAEHSVHERQTASIRDHNIFWIAKLTEAGLNRQLPDFFLQACRIQQFKKVGILFDDVAYLYEDEYVSSSSGTGIHYDVPTSIQSFSDNSECSGMSVVTSTDDDETSDIRGASSRQVDENLNKSENESLNENKILNEGDSAAEVNESEPSIDEQPHVSASDLDGPGRTSTRESVDYNSTGSMIDGNSSTGSFSGPKELSREVNSRNIAEAFQLFGKASLNQEEHDSVLAAIDDMDVVIASESIMNRTRIYQAAAYAKVARLPAGVTVVVCSTDSKTDNGYAELNEKCRETAIFTTPEGMISCLFHGLFSKDYWVLYIVPSKFFANGFNMLKYLCRRVKVRRVVFDEAGGMDVPNKFRESYLGFLQHRLESEEFKILPVSIALSTFTQGLKESLLPLLRPTKTRVSVESKNCPQIYHSVVQKPRGQKEIIAKIAEICRKHKSKRGIVRCFTHKECDTVAKQLNKWQGITTRTLEKDYNTIHNDPEQYRHNGSSDDGGIYGSSLNRSSGGPLPRWMVDSTPQVLCMLKTDYVPVFYDERTEFIIFLKFSISATAYYEDTKKALYGPGSVSAYTLYNPGDRYWLADKLDLVRTREMDEMVKYCENNTKCRRQYLMEMFGETFDPSNCKNQCDICDGSSAAMRASQAIQVNPQPAPSQVVDAPTQVDDDKQRQGHQASTGDAAAVSSAQTAQFVVLKIQQRQILEAFPALMIPRLEVCRHLLGESLSESMNSVWLGTLRYMGYAHLKRAIDELVRSGEVQLAEKEGVIYCGTTASNPPGA